MIITQCIYDVCVEDIADTSSQRLSRQTKWYLKT